MTRQKSKSDRYESTDGALATFLCAARSAAFTVCVAALMLVIFAALASSATDPASVTDIFAYAVLAISSFIGGVIAYFCAKDNAGAVSLMSGGLFVALLVILALAFDGVNSPLYMIIGYGASVALHFLGAWLSQRLFSRKKRRRSNIYGA